MTRSTSQADRPSDHIFAQRVGLIVFFVFLVYLARDFLAPVAVGAVFAVVFSPFFNFLRSHIKEGPRQRRLAAAATTLLFGLSVLLPIGGMIFAGADAGLDQLEVLRKSSEDNGNSMLSWMESQRIVERAAEWLPMDEDQLNSSIQAGLGALAGGIANLLQAILAQIPYVLISGLVVLLAVYYLLIDGEKIVAMTEKRSPFPKRQTATVLRSVKASCNSAIMASLVTGLFQAVLMTVGGLIFGVPKVVLIGLATFVFSLVPLIGTAPITLGIVIGFFISGQTGHAIGFILVGVFIGITDNFVRPYLVRSGTRIHPLSAFVFTFGAVATIGFYGLFIGPVAAGILSGMIRSWKENGP